MNMCYTELTTGNDNGADKPVQTRAKSPVGGNGYETKVGKYAFGLTCKRNNSLFGAGYADRYFAAAF